MRAPHVLRITRAGAKTDNRYAELTAGIGQDFQMSEAFLPFSRVRMDHVKSAGGSGRSNAPRQQGMMDLFQQFWIDRFWHAGQAGTGEIELNAPQPVRSNSIQNSFERGPKKCFGKNSKLHERQKGGQVC